LTEKIARDGQLDCQPYNHANLMNDLLAEGGYGRYGAFLMELSGIELLASSLRTRTKFGTRKTLNLLYYFFKSTQKSV
jgi:hypothetical protein